MVTSKPANGEAFGTLTARRGFRLRRHEQCLERRKKTTSHRAWAARMVVTAHRATDRCSPRDRRRLPEGGGNRVCARSLGTSGPSKPANEPPTDSTAAKPANEVTTDSGCQNPPRQPAAAPSASACEPYRETHRAGLSRGRNAMAIWQDLVDGHGFAGGYASVKRFVRKLRGAHAPEARAVIIRPRPAKRPSRLRHGPDGARSADRQVPAHAAVRADARLQPQSRSACWSSAPARASGPSCTSKPFAGWAASPRVVVLDNLREGVLTPDIYDPTLNPLYRDVLAHYGVVALPCRVRDPDRKGKVESGVGHAQKTPLKGLRFESLEEAQAYLDRWESAGPTRASTARPSGKSPPCLPKRSRRCCRCRSNRFAITSTANAPCISTAASKSKPPTTARRRAGSGAGSTCNGTSCTCASSIRTPGNCCASICASSAAATASKTRIVPSKRRCARCSCSRRAAHRRHPHRRALRRYPSATKAKRRAPHPRRARAGQETRRRRRRRCLRRRARNRRARTTASCAATSSAARNCR